MDKSFKALVLTYKTAPVALREQVSLTESEAKQLLNFLRDYAAATEILIVSTCNRTEIYYCSENDQSHVIFNGLKLIKKTESDFENHFISLAGKEAIQHLFEVGIGLDAQVIGDLQISGQVKNAYQWSADENMAGPFLHRLMHTIFFCNKRVVQETSFRDGAASISYATKELVEDVTFGLANPKILVIGVGEIGQDFCLNLAGSKLKNVTIINRTIEKAEKLATRCGFAYAGMESLPEEVGKADVVVSSVSGTQPIVNRELLSNIKIHSHKFFFDLSMPRSVDSSIEEIPGVIVYNPLCTILITFKRRPTKH
jgi:glutamyl-tRNA reductase